MFVPRAEAGLLPALFVPVRWAGLVVDLATFVVYDDRRFANGIGGWGRICISRAESGDREQGGALRQTRMGRNQGVFSAGSAYLGLPLR